MTEPAYQSGAEQERMRWQEAAQTLVSLTNAVIGDIPEDRHLWRINWLKSLLDAFDDGQIIIGDKCDDPASVRDCIAICAEMVRDVNDALVDQPQVSRD